MLLLLLASMRAGVWAAGESWHYAPLAASLARLGVITCVMQYSLYPDALVPQMVQEVAAAFDWTLANVGSYGGDASKVGVG
jgi:acetyl esterase/lipase